MLEPHPEGVTIITALNDDVMPIQGGAAQIYRVFSNLTINAFDAMPGGGELRISTENCYVDEQSGRFSQIPVGEYVLVTVTDTGHGIPKESLTKIFDPFFTTKKADRKRGSGLGLHFHVPPLTRNKLPRSGTSSNHRPFGSSPTESSGDVASV